MSFTIGSLFDGSGTAPLAATILGGTPLWASEIEPYPVAVTKARFPNMAHLGDITKINGAEVAPVDIIVGGSPCQDLSVAGKQVGLENGTRSNLFYEMTRIIREMRGATNGKYPRFVVWENVPGAFSSNKGNDFHAVVSAFCALADDPISIPRPPADKTGRLTWKNAGSIVGDGWSLGWRVLDAQYWGVPQRRRRIFAVLDLGSERAGEILFERAGLPWNTEPCGKKRQGTSSDAVGCIDRSGGVRCLNPWMPQSARIYDVDGIYPALSANATGGLNRQAVIGQVGSFCAGAAPAAGSIGYSERVAPTLKAGQCAFPMGAVVYEPMSVKDENWAESDTKNALRAGASRSSHAVVYAIDPLSSNSMKSSNPNSGFHEENYVKCLDTSDGNPCKNQGGNLIVQDIVYALQGNGIDRALTAGCNGAGWREGEKYTLNTIDRPAVVYSIDQQGGKGAANYDENVMCPILSDSHGTPHAVAYGIDCRNGALNEEITPTLQAKENGGQSLNYMPPVLMESAQANAAITEGIAPCLNASHEQPIMCTQAKPPRRYIVRRLTPTECARLQGFPDWWTDGVPGSDSAKYKMWGNGMALTCMLAVMNGVKGVSE